MPMSPTLFTYMNRIYTITLGLLMTVALGACNVFEGFNSDAGLSSNVNALMTDGQRAIQKGDTREAVRIFTRAVAVSSASSYEGRVARIKLATAKLSDKNINVLTLQNTAAGLVGELDSVPATPSFSAGAGSVCSFEAPHTGYAEIDLNAISGFSTLRANTATLAEVRTLMQEALSIGAAPTRAQIDAGLQALRSDGADDNLLAEALINGAVSFTSLAYDVIVSTDSNAVKWVKVRQPEGSNYLGYCTASQAAYNELHAQTMQQVNVIGAAVEMFAARADLAIFSEGSVSHTLAVEVRKAYTRLKQEFSVNG